MVSGTKNGHLGRVICPKWTKGCLTFFFKGEYFCFKLQQTLEKERRKVPNFDVVNQL